MSHLIPEGEKGGGKGGGGGQSARAAREDPNTLRSKRVARVIDLISEGPIVGLVDGWKSVFLNDTPLQSANGSVNFNGVTFETRDGDPVQDPIPGIPSASSEVIVNTEVKAGFNNRLVRTINDTEVDAATVTIRLPSLSKQDTTTGDLHGTDVRIQIYLVPSNAARTLMRDHTISGKTTSPYEISFRVPMFGAGPWELEVSRATADSDSVTLRNETWWTSYTASIEAKLEYPDSALIGLAVDAEQFGAEVPQRAYEIKGRIISVPTNYDPVTRIYTGIWDGTFKQAWTDNPAWVFYDLLTHERYGLGEHVGAAAVDKWRLFEIAQYCDGLVADGFGGQEPRFTCNVAINTRQQAHDVLNALASVFRGMPYWSSGLVTATQDAPADPVRLVTRANVIDGEFIYEGSALKARHTVALVSWTNPDNGYRPSIEVVEDTEALERFGYREKQVVAYGATSRGQAHRFGKWSLFAEQNETELVSYVAGLDHADVRPGDIVSISDDTIAGARYGGRVRSVATAPEGNFFNDTIVSGGVPYLVTQDGNGRYTVERNSGGYSTAMGVATVSTVAGKPYRLTLPNSVSSHQSRIAINGVLFDNVNVAEFTAIGSTTEIHFAATASGIATWSFDEPVLERTEQPTLTLDKAPVIGDVTGWSIMVTLPDGAIETKALSSLAGDVATVPALSAVPVAGAIWLLTQASVEPRQFRVLSITEDDGHLFKISALEHNPAKYNAIEQGFAFEEQDFTSIPDGPLSTPPSVAVSEYLYRQGPRVAAGMTISWTHPSDPRVAYYRVDSMGPNETAFGTVGWPSANSFDLRDARSGSYTFRIHSVDALGRVSSSFVEHTHINQGLLAAPASPTNLRLSVNARLATLVWQGVTDLDLSHYEVRFTGATSGAIWENMQVLVAEVAPGTTTVVLPSRVGTFAVKAVDQSGVYSDAAAFAVSTSLPLLTTNVVEKREEAPAWAGSKTSTEVEFGALRLTKSVDNTFPADGQYQANSAVDLNGVFSTHVTSNLTVSGDNIDNTMSTWTTLASVSALSGTNPTEWSVRAEMRTSDDAVTWTGWVELLATEVTARHYEFRLVLESYNEKVTPNVTDWTVTVDMPDRVERGQDVVAPAAGVTITYDPAFAAKPALAIDGQDLLQGDYYQRSNASASGFDLIFRNSAGTAVERTFDWIAAGYGRKQD